MVVAGVGSFVDYKKELAFVQSRHKSDAKNVVSTAYLFSLVTLVPF
jgi:hypothetical protein